MHAFTSRGFDSVSWAFLYLFVIFNDLINKFGYTVTEANAYFTAIGLHCQQESRAVAGNTQDAAVTFQDGSRLPS